MFNPDGSGNGHVSKNTTTKIDKRDFDAHRPLLSEGEEASGRGRGRGRALSGSRVTRIPVDGGDGDDDGRSDGLLSDVVEEIVERDRRRLKKEIVRFFSFVWGVISWWVVTSSRFPSNEVAQLTDCLFHTASVLEVSPPFRSTALCCLPGFTIPKTESMPSPSPPRSPCTCPSRFSDICVIATRRRPCRSWPESSLARAISSPPFRTGAVRRSTRAVPGGRFGSWSWPSPWWVLAPAVCTGLR